jgi:hypothetical protein
VSLTNDSGSCEGQQDEYEQKLKYERQPHVGGCAQIGLFLQQISFLGAFPKVRKSTISFMSVCLSVRMEQLGSHWTDFDETKYLNFFRKSVQTIQVS